MLFWALKVKLVSGCAMLVRSAQAGRQWCLIDLTFVHLRSNVLAILFALRQPTLHCGGLRQCLVDDAGRTCTSCNCYMRAAAPQVQV